jgi:hypothetical protein
MTTNKCGDGSNACKKGEDCNQPLILSESATAEILGDKLCFLIAIGKDGKPVRFLPYGADLSASEDDLSEDDTASILDISVRVPIGGSSPGECSPLGFGSFEPNCLSARAVCWCKQGGVRIPC